MSGGRSHETKGSIDEWPIAVQESSACVDEVLQDGKDVREGSRVASEWSEIRRSERVHVFPIIIAGVHQQCCEVLRVWMPPLEFAIGQLAELCSSSHAVRDARLRRQ